MRLTLTRLLAGVLALTVIGTTQPMLAQQPDQAQGQSQPSAQNPLPPVELPENPGRSSSQSPTTQQNAQQPAQGTEPSGTAVAPPVEVSGGAASKPAGVAIAPPKQHQVRSLVLKLGLIAGAGIAIGTVVGLSAASPSRVPNSGH